jgi:hypothetical protein
MKATPTRAVLELKATALPLLALPLLPLLCVGVEEWVCEEPGVEASVGMEAPVALATHLDAPDGKVSDAPELTVPFPAKSQAAGFCF